MSWLLDKIAPWRLWLAVGAVLVVAGWVGALMVQNARQERRIASLTEEVGRLERSVAAFELQARQSAEARAVEEARAARWEKRARQYDEALKYVENGDLPDEPLDPRIIDALRSLRTQAAD